VSHKTCIQFISSPERKIESRGLTLWRKTYRTQKKHKDGSTKSGQNPLFVAAALFCKHNESMKQDQDGEGYRYLVHYVGSFAKQDASHQQKL
jgi:hypothetical protein